MTRESSSPGPCAHTARIRVTSQGNGHITDITNQTQRILSESGILEGQCCVFAPGATAGITTIEYEPGLQQDFPEAMERIAPRNIRYHHDDTWHDGNGHSHVRASLLGPSLVVPFEDGRLILGTWQQIILVDFDNRSRTRDIVVQILGVR